RKRIKDEKRTPKPNKPKNKKCRICGRFGHRSRNCNSNKGGGGKPKPKGSDGGGGGGGNGGRRKCFRCEQSGHFVRDCKVNNKITKAYDAKRERNRDTIPRKVFNITKKKMQKLADKSIVNALNNIQINDQFSFATDGKDCYSPAQKMELMNLTKKIARKAVNQFHKTGSFGGGKREESSDEESERVVTSKKGRRKKIDVVFNPKSNRKPFSIFRYSYILPLPSRSHGSTVFSADINAT
ncbi:MAG: hypothetical protein GY818_19745, partial [Planctomycetaceae bacterium]|nr:hypothetical protein [Planctomycetaceae bacterium]